MGEILKLIQQAQLWASSLQAVIPQIEEAYGQIKDALGSHDDAAIRAQIDALHNAIAVNRAALDALRDPVVEPVVAAKK